MTPTLEAQVVRFRQMYPNSSIRFAETIGKRLSHVAGPVDEIHSHERRIRVNGRIVMLASDENGISDEDMERFAQQTCLALARAASRPT